MKKFLSLLAIMMTFVFFSPLRLKAQSIESVNWYFAGWQLNLSDVLNRASQNEKLYFSNGTMVWSGMENNGSQRDTYSINGNMIYRGNGGWFKIINHTDKILVLSSNDGIYRTFTRDAGCSAPSSSAFESCNWHFNGWQLSLNDQLRSSSPNEQINFSNGTMVWSGMENNGSQRDTYSINGNMIYRGNGGWFKIISLSGDRMVLLANDNIYRTFTKNTSVSNPSNIYQFSIGPIIEPETTSGGGSTYVPTTTTNTTTKTAGDDSWKRQRRIELQNQLQRAQSSESLAYEQWMKEKTGTAHIAYTSAKNYRETIQRQLDSLK